MISFLHQVEFLQMISRYGLLPLVIIESILLAVLLKNNLTEEISLFRGFIEFHKSNSLLKITAIKVIIAALISYPIVIFGRPALFIIYSIHVIILGFRLIFLGLNEKRL